MVVRLAWSQLPLHRPNCLESLSRQWSLENISLQHALSQSGLVGPSLDSQELHVSHNPLHDLVHGTSAVMADFGQTDFGQPFLLPNLAKPTLARVSVLVVWPTLAKTDFGQTDFGQIEFDLLCGVLVLCCVVCCLSGVGTVSRYSGVSCVGVGFKVWFGQPFPGPPFPWTALPLDRPSPGPPFPWTALPLDRPKFRRRGFTRQPESPNVHI